MARFCFYCGRELSSGEKCNCRSTGKTHTSSAAPGSGSAGNVHAQSTGSSKASAAGKRTGRQIKGNVFKRFFNAFNPLASGSANRANATGNARGTGKRTTGQAYKAQPVRNPLTWKHALLSIRRFGHYLASPTDSIRESVRGGNGRTVLLILLFQGFCGGFFLFAASGLPLIRSLLSLSMATLSSDSNPTISFFIFFQGFGISIAATLMLVLLYQLALRFLYRSPAPFFTLLSGFSPASLYFSIFLLAGALTLSSSIFSAFLLALAGFAIATAAQYLAVSEISGFDKNRSFMLVTFVMLIYTSVLSLLLNLSLPFLKVLLDQTTVF